MFRTVMNLTGCDRRGRVNDEDGVSYERCEVPSPRLPTAIWDIPQRCRLVQHDVELVEGAKPIKHAPYRMNPAKRELLEQEVKFLLPHNFVERSSSEWASLCLLGPKPDGRSRMCTDYLIVYSSTWEEHLSRLRLLLVNFAEACLTINLLKSEFGHAKLVYLWHIVGFGERPPTCPASENI
ncbi:Transposon Ty3-I Gag-Pol polyprotein-like [Homarus americanus]|uniref:Transposon Ty3-I Gag-Pol polyprotein-like n=1 Tax=Homarus americanus TaxID=6706 RepID=A0A8J5JWA5_HOMAM|nr:Transposon Ty3-I Gag-Pol polyprotein-like [Homarus americanus]